jgi:hypothetical protein
VVRVHTSTSTKAIKSQLSQTNDTDIYVSSKTKLLNKTTAYSGTSTVPDMSIQFLLSSTVSATETASTYASIVDGSFWVDNNTKSFSYTLSTPTAYSGGNDKGVFTTPTAGVIRAKDDKLNLLTQITLTPMDVKLLADSDRNETLDLSLTTTYTDLSK